MRGEGNHPPVAEDDTEPEEDDRKRQGRPRNDAFGEAREDEDERGERQKRQEIGHLGILRGTLTPSGAILGPWGHGVS